MIEQENKAFLSRGTEFQTLYVKYVGNGKCVANDDIVVPENLIDNPFALMEAEWFDLWGAYYESYICLEKFDDLEGLNDEIDRVEKLINNSSLNYPQKNWAKAVYMKWFYKRECPFSPSATIQDFINLHK